MLHGYEQVLIKFVNDDVTFTFIKKPKVRVTSHLSIMSLS